ncbi:catalase-like domain-containing protein [Radiomyces spectabilis]|uniref:catalase-like domain-containing protein n=1 Tax=Radiomyces spectabilis TaxID=64574 RepID=UPI00221F9449|nr:catalase-like domain-containing protein [Radiomyces spectabilis]KAI8394088.1 catalase-like domain-containing protein [Radiomyces spectabilis]
MRTVTLYCISVLLCMSNLLLVRAQCPFHVKRDLVRREGDNTPKQDQLDEFGVTDAGTQETTNFGVKINNTDSLKVGLRGPTLMEDFMLREKIMHFDHERIPERVVHARGVGAHGYFEPYKDWSDLTAARFLRTPGKRTSVFVRFSTVLGSRGSADTVRDVRGFATRFYTEEGIFDLVGNAIAPFFVQDAIKFPDLIHAAKPEPDTEVPQAATAHDTAYDFFSVLPETLHTLLWALSGRGIPRSFRQVEGFGVHTFRLINENGNFVFVKFIWKPKQGLSNLVWDEAQKIAGKDSDFHRNDLYTAISRGDYPEWELGVQIVPEQDQHKFDFDLLDATKIIPESLVPFTPLGKMVLNRNVDNFFAETEQITFHPGHIVRGIGFTNDPLLQGRLFSYLDTQLNRMSSANFMQLPINRPINPVHNNQRDGFMQHAIHEGKVAYYPNGLQGNTPSVVDGQDGGYIEFPEQVEGRKMRGRVDKFFDFYSQPQLFWNSLTEAEQQQLVNGARFEIGKVKSLDVRKRMIHTLNHVDNSLARRVAIAVGVQPPDAIVVNQNRTTVGLSIERYPKPDNIRTRTVAILTAPGTNIGEAEEMFNYLEEQGAYPEYIGLTLGVHNGLNVTNTYMTSSSVLFDAVYVPGGQEAMSILMDNLSIFPYEEPVMFVLDAYRHGKPIAVSSEGSQLLAAAKINLSNPAEQDGVLIGDDMPALQEQFRQALIEQRFWSRLPLDPPQ